MAGDFVATRGRKIVARRDKKVVKSEQAGRTAQVATVQNRAISGSAGLGDETTKTKKCIFPQCDLSSVLS